MDSLEQHKLPDGTLKPIFRGLPTEFARRITGNSDKAPSSALPKFHGEAQPPWVPKVITDLKWWELRRIFRSRSDTSGVPAKI
eukprot:10736160-Alexandrium_andersonii.AAC.1